MSQILLHTSSKQNSLQTQALRLQKELQTMGHEVEFSSQTHPTRILKNNYEVLHILSETHDLNLYDKSLLLAARAKNQMHRLANVVSSFESETRKKNILHSLQFRLIDAFSTLDLENLKFYKEIRPSKFILPFFPTPKVVTPSVAPLSSSLFYLKPVLKNYSELKESLIPSEVILAVDASSLSQELGLATARKKWRLFQKRHPEFKDAVLILQFENVIELLRNHLVILDIGSLSNALKFQTLVDWACAYQQFIVLNKNQASGFPDFWKHQKNCWITDLNENHSDIKSAAKKFFKNKKIPLTISVENKMNELSRLYSKLIYEKSLSFVADKVSIS